MTSREPGLYKLEQVLYFYDRDRGDNLEPVAPPGSEYSQHNRKRIMKTLRSILTVIIPVACALLVGCSKTDNTPPTGVAGVTPEGQMEMQFKWIVGKQYITRMDMHQTSEIQVPNVKQPMQQLMNMAQDYTISVVKELPDGGRELGLEFTGMNLSSKVGDRVVLNFDSSQDPSGDAGNPVGTMLRKMVGSRLKYLTDADGRVASVEGVRELSDRITSGNNPELQASFSSMYSEGYLKQLCDAARMAPGRGVKPGDSWTMNFSEEMGSAGKIAVNAKMKFEDWEQHGDRKCARIESKGDITSSPVEAANGTATAMSISIEKGKFTATAWFDPALGNIVESTSDQSLTIKITAQGRTMESNTKQQVNYKLLDVADVAK
jgi:Family of unknown function (DUF6263)